MRRVWLILVIAATGRGQECAKPLGAMDLHDLLAKKVSEALVRQLVTTCGLTMALDDAAQGELRRLGASESLVTLVREKATLPVSDLELRAEIEHWSGSKDSTDPAVFADYLQRYPKGRFVVLAQAKLNALRKQTPAVPTRQASLHSPDHVPPPPVTFRVTHVHRPSGVLLRSTTCAGTLTVNNEGLTFQPDTSNGHPIQIRMAELNRVSMTAYDGSSGGVVNINNSATIFGGFRTGQDADVLFDAVEAVMREAGKFGGTSTSIYAVTHEHGVFKSCSGILTITTTGMEFQSNQHEFSFAHDRETFIAGIRGRDWTLIVRERTSRMKLAVFNMQETMTAGMLRSLWGKPTGRDKDGWLYWEHPTK